ncbi:MAG: hypothetical protein HQK49_17670 [Oligoflexia bacterium]|nr:hypothetical protein [Oligoflexia bacterium]
MKSVKKSAKKSTKKSVKKNVKKSVKNKVIAKKVTDKKAITKKVTGKKIIGKKVTTKKVTSKKVVSKKVTTDLYNKEKLQRLLSSAVKLSKADHVEIYCSIEDRQATRFSDNAISQNLAQKNLQIKIASHMGNKIGRVDINSFDKEIIERAIRQSEEIAIILPDDPEYLPPLQKGEGKQYLKSKISKKDVDDHLSFDQIAQKIQEGINSCKKKSAKFAGSYKHSRYQEAYMNSNGLFAHGYYSSVDWTNIVVMPKGESGYAHGMSCNVKDLDFKSTSKEALDKAVAAQNPIDLEPGKYTVILSPEAVDEILMFAFYGGFDAKRSDEGMTFLRGKLGHKVFDSKLTIASDPCNVNAPSLVFDTQGSAFKKRLWVKEGVIENLCYSRYWGHKNNKEVTLYPTNLIVEGNDKISLENLVANTKRGILITRLWYIRFVDPMIPSITGMTRDGTYLIENGKIVSAIKNMRFNDSVVRIFNNIETIGKRRISGEWFRSYIPFMKIKEFNFTSKTAF